MPSYEPVIGIECHVQLKTNSKLFCGCDNNARDKAPNTTVCPVCMGFPGTLPVLNEQAVKYALRLGAALNAKIPHHTKYDRKNYFYPDLPKGYQISQFDEPIVGPGYIEFPVNGQPTKVRITRAHLEEDAGKLIHPPGVDYSLVDLNRAGTPLMEIVSEPDIYSAAAAKAYAQELHNIVRYTDVSDADMYQGNMRVDVNISVRRAGADLGTRTEIKNLNSFKAVERAVEYEFKRQVELLEKGERVVQETRGWNEDKGITFSQRSKEEAHDYRYFPEPDLPPIKVTKQMLEDAQLDLVTPTRARQDLKLSGLDQATIEVIVSDPDLARLVMEAAKRDSQDIVRIMANWLVGSVQKMLSDSQTKLVSSDFDFEVKIDGLIQLAHLVKVGKISQTAAKQLLANFMLETYSSLDEKKDIEKMAIEADLIQVSDTGELDKIIKAVIVTNPQAVADYKAGKQQALGALVGQVMKQSRGQANPQLARELLLKKLK
jgi:aspartyl-tRNA(Asn)/glutamyl-tRNA(Gln) amidotransferase subunit B